MPTANDYGWSSNTGRGGAPALSNFHGSGAAFQLADTSRDYNIYLQIKSVTHGFTLSIGADNHTTLALFTADDLASSQLMFFRLPAAWWISWSATLGGIKNSCAVGC